MAFFSKRAREPDGTPSATAAPTESPPPPRSYTKRPSLELGAHTREESRPDGTRTIGSGFRVFSTSSGLMVWNDDAAMRRAGIVVVDCVGVAHTGDVLQSDAFAPGRRVALMPDPTNPHDRNAIGVWDADRTVRVGWLPARVAAELAPLIASGDARAAFVIWQHRDPDSGRRLGINVLTAPPHIVGYLLAGQEANG